MQAETKVTQSDILDPYKPYTFTQVLKRSLTGFVYIVESAKSPDSLVLKIIPLDHLQDPAFEEKKKNAEEEYMNMLILAYHPSFVKPIDSRYYENAGHGYYDILMEHCGKPLADIKFDQKISLLTKIEWMRQCVDAMAYAESKSIYHGDIKPHNLLIKNGITLKLIDLGGSRSVGATTYAKTIARVTEKVKEFTPCYAAPELLEGQGPIIMNKLDVYAFGKTFYEIFYNKTAKELDEERLKLCSVDPNTHFLRTDEGWYEEWTKSLLDRKLPDDNEVKYAKVISQILSLCLQYKPDKRPTFAELKAFLSTELHLIKEVGIEEEKRGLSEAEAPETIKYKGRPKPEEEEAKGVFINQYENYTKIINVYPDLQVAMVVNVEGEGGWMNLKNFYSVPLGKEVGSIPSMAQSVMIGVDKVLVIGGKLELGYSNTLYEVTIKEIEERKSLRGQARTQPTGQSKVISTACCKKCKVKLKHPRALFGLTLIRGVAYIIGGITNTERLLKECEAYSVENEEISQMPSISEPKESIAVCNYQDKWVFAFGGRKQDFGTGMNNMLNSFSNVIEQYDVENKYWNQIKIKGGSTYSGSASSAAVQTSVGQILLFGGIMHQPGEEAFELTFKTTDYNVKGKVFTKTEESKIVITTGYMGAAYFANGRVYAFNLPDDAENEAGVYMYDLDNKEWRVHYFVAKQDLDTCQLINSLIINKFIPSSLLLLLLHVPLFVKVQPRIH
eukprot:TRINITY_DN1314_c0_g1_i1.p1 TRINITY_DN1314_c0_g1~~TRINITY_DN1314_c0_g1_i1.p1  ORF type:complete len:728 (+),score=81.71 TRINITY_DN1314_c0_g1_i1:53-2236(+)